MKSVRGQVRDMPTELKRRPTPGLYRFRIAERVCQHEQIVSERLTPPSVTPPGKASHRARTWRAHLVS